jgi:hypothetical protein
MQRHIGWVVATALVCGASAWAGEQAPSIGIDVGGMDRSIRPGDDFNGYANGTWIKTAEIPADRSSTGIFLQVFQKAEQRTADLIRDAEKEGKDANARHIADYYAAWMDEAAIEKAGLSPLKPELAKIDAIASRTDLGPLVVVFHPFSKYCLWANEYCLWANERLNKQRSGNPSDSESDESPRPRRKGRPRDGSGGRDNARTSEAVEKRDQSRDVDRTFLLGPANTVGEITTRLRVVQGAPTIRVEVDGAQRNFIVDTGSSISLIQPDVSASVIREAGVAPIGVTGAQLRLKGEQVVEFGFHGCMFRYPFQVCSLPTDADGLVGMDLLIHLKARLDRDTLTLTVKEPTVARPVVFTVFAGREGPPTSVAEANGRRRNVGRQDAVMRRRPDELTLREPDARVVTLPETRRVAPRTQQVVKGRKVEPAGARSKKYGRNASVRDFDEGDVVYLHNPRGTPKLSRKFRMIWTGPFRVQRRTGQLNYAIESPDGKEQAVHVNRLKRANNPGIWETKARAPRSKRGPKPRSDTEEEDVEPQAERPLRRGAPLVDNRQPVHRTPDRARPLEPETPATEDSGRNDARELHGDPDFVPSGSPRSRLQLQTTRDLPPQTRARTRLRALRDESQ